MKFKCVFVNGCALMLLRSSLPFCFFRFLLDGGVRRGASLLSYTIPYYIILYVYSMLIALFVCLGVVLVWSVVLVGSVSAATSNFDDFEIKEKKIVTIDIDRSEAKTIFLHVIERKFEFELINFILSKLACKNFT